MAEETYNSDEFITAAGEYGKSIKKNPQSILPPLAGLQPRAEARDYIASALMGLQSGLRESQAASASGDPLTAALAGFAGSVQQPGAQALATQRFTQGQAAQMAALQNLPLRQLSAGLAEKFPEIADLPIGVAERFFPVLQRHSALEQQLELAKLRLEESERRRQDGKDRRDRLPANTVLVLNEGQAVSRGLPDVEKAILSNSDIFGPVEGAARAFNPYDTRAQTVRAELRTASQAFGRFMEGGVLRKEDEAKYEKMFPQLGDTLGVAKNKLAIVRRKLAEKYESDIRVMGKSGFDVSGFDRLEVPPSMFDGGKNAGTTPVAPAPGGGEESPIVLPGAKGKRLAELREKAAQKGKK